MVRIRKNGSVSVRERSGAESDGRKNGQLRYAQVFAGQRQTKKKRQTITFSGEMYVSWLGEGSDSVKMYSFGYGARVGLKGSTSLRKRPVAGSHCQ